MTTDKPIAHFFWEGKLTKFQLLSFKSAYDAGFEVIVWSLTPHELPDYLTGKDAREILDPDTVNSSKYDYFFGTLPEHKAHAAIALYSDFFRAKLLTERTGWWFDSDIVVLKSAEEFEQLKSGKDIVVAHEISYKDVGRVSVNTSVITIPNKELKVKYWAGMTHRLKNSPDQVSWAFYGPQFMSHFVLTNGLFNQVLSEELIYPIPFQNASALYSPAAKEYCEKRTKDAYTIHWWNSGWSNKQYGDNPPVGSFFDDLLKKHGLKD